MNSLKIYHCAGGLLLAIIFIFGLNSCAKQPNSKPESLPIVNVDSVQWKQTDSLYTVAKNLFREREFTAAEKVFDTLPETYLKQQRYSAYFYCLRNKAVNYRALQKDEDTILSLLREGLPNVEKAPQNLFETYSYYLSLGVSNTRLGNLIDAKFYGDLALKVVQDSINLDKKDIEQAYLECYDNLANAEWNLYNYDTAEAYYLKQYNLQQLDSKRTRILIDMLGSYQEAGFQDKVKTILDTVSWEARMKDASFFQSYVFNSHKLEYFLSTNQNEEALEVANQLKKLIQGSGYEAHFSSWFLNQRIYRIYFAMEQYEKVIAIIENTVMANNEAKDYLDSESYDMFWLAKAYFYNGDLDTAKYHLLKAINWHLPKENGSVDVLDPVNINEVRFQQRLVSKIMFKAKLCVEWFERTQNMDYLNTAMRDYQKVHELLKQLGFGSTEDGFLKDEFFKEFYGDYLKLAFKIWELNPSDDLFYNALTTCDEARNIAVLRELSEVNQTRLFKNIPFEIKRKQQSLKTSLDSLSLHYNSQIERKARTTLRDSLQRELSKFQTELKAQYPKYYELVYGHSLTLQELILEQYPNDNVIEYFMGTAYIYVFNINSGNLTFNRIALTDTLKKQLASFSEALRDPNNPSFSELGTIANQILLEPFFDPSKKTLLVLDGMLHDLPFEAFVSSNAFLVEQTSMHRLNSLSQQIREPITEEVTAFALAPFATVSSSNKPIIGSSLGEANSVKQAFGGTVKTNRSATKETFIDNAIAFPVIHLATHSKVDEDNPIRSAIYFASEDGTKPSDYTLQLDELYSLELNAELVALSSCETGIGKEVKGKGVQSISNAFNYAGVSSTVMSLWKVPDKETSQIMQSFYKHLSNGTSKDIALRDAKLDYLSNTKDEVLKHPYYWAGFVISGNIAPLKTSAPLETNWIWVLGGALVLILAIWGVLHLLRRRKRT